MAKFIMKRNTSTVPCISNYIVSVYMLCLYEYSGFQAAFACLSTMLLYNTQSILRIQGIYCMNVKVTRL